MVGERSAPLRLWTVGHSTRTLEELIALLREPSIELLVDVRRFPASRRHPHFAGEALASALASAGIEYRHEIDLGGRREPQVDSRNHAWRVEAFRGYADHTATAPFGRALDRVLVEAAERRTAIVCAEAHPSRCHRRLIADVAVLRGWSVVHLIAPGRTEEHALHSQARLQPDGTAVWGGEQERLRFDS